MLTVLGRLLTAKPRPVGTFLYYTFTIKLNWTNTGGQMCYSSDFVVFLLISLQNNLVHPESPSVGVLSLAFYLLSLKINLI